MPDESQTSRRGMRLLFLLLLLIGVGVRTIEAERKSLWLDEFHTLWVANADTLGEFTDRIGPDFHAPLYFLLVRAVDRSTTIELRWVSILGGLLSIPFLLAILRDGGVRPMGRMVAASAMLFLPFQVQYGTELRPYAFMQTAALAIVWAATSSRAGARTRFLSLAAATAIGLYTHYLIAIVVLGVGAARMFVHGAGMLPFRKVVLGGTIGVLLFLPWIAVVESWVFTDPGVMLRVESDDREEDAADLVGRSRSRSELLRESLKAAPRLALPAIRGLGHQAGSIAGGSMGLAFILAAVGGWRSRKRNVESVSGDSRILVAAVLSAAITLGITGLLCIEFWERVPIQYGADGAWIIAAILGIVAQRFDRREGLGLVMLLVVAGLAHACGNSREDLRTGVTTAIRQVEASEGHVTAVLRQPIHYLHTPPIRLYSPGAHPVEPYAIPADGKPVVVITRNTIPDSEGAVWKKIFQGRKLHRSIQIDQSVSIRVFRPADPAAAR